MLAVPQGGLGAGVLREAVFVVSLSDLMAAASKNESLAARATSRWTHLDNGAFSGWDGGHGELNLFLPFRMEAVACQQNVSDSSISKDIIAVPQNTGIWVLVNVTSPTYEPDYQHRVTTHCELRTPIDAIRASALRFPNGSLARPSLQRAVLYANTTANDHPQSN